MKITQTFPRKRRKDFVNESLVDISFNVLYKNFQMEEISKLLKDNRSNFNLMFGPSPHFYFVGERKMHGWCLTFEGHEYWVLTGKSKGTCYEAREANSERDLRFFSEILNIYK